MFCQSSSPLIYDFFTPKPHLKRESAPQSSFTLFLFEKENNHSEVIIMNILNLQPPISSIEDRLKHTPKVQSDRGYWTGERGNSIYCPKHNDTVLDALHKFDLPGMPYIDGMLDPRQCTIGTVCLLQMSTKRYKNFSECDRLCAAYWNEIHYLGHNDWTRHIVANYRKSRHYTWHERNDRIQCDLIPTVIHSFFPHLGGISECKRA